MSRVFSRLQSGNARDFAQLSEPEVGSPALFEPVADNRHGHEEGALLVTVYEAGAVAHVHHAEDAKLVLVALRVTSARLLALDVAGGNAGHDLSYVTLLGLPFGTLEGRDVANRIGPRVAPHLAGRMDRNESRLAQGQIRFTDDGVTGARSDEHDQVGHEPAVVLEDHAAFDELLDLLAGVGADVVGAEHPVHPLDRFLSHANARTSHGSEEAELEVPEQTAFLQEMVQIEQELEARTAADPARVLGITPEADRDAAAPPLQQSIQAFPHPHAFLGSAADREDVLFSLVRHLARAERDDKVVEVLPLA